MHPLSIQQAKLILLLALACSCPTVLANGFSFSAATDFTTGKYGGTTSTDIWYAPFTARYDRGRASFRVIVPYLNITGPGNVLGPGIGGIDDRGTLIGGGFSGSPSIGGGIFVCDEKNDDCSNNTSGRRGSSSGSGSSSDNDHSGSGSSNANNDNNNSGPGSSGGNNNNNNSGPGSGDDDNNNKNSGPGSGDDNPTDDKPGLGNSGSNDDDDSGSGNSKLKQTIASVPGITGGIVGLGGSSLSRSTQSGLGDIITAFSHNLIDHAPTGIAFDITARLKIPTASTHHNLGSGKVDYAIQGDLFKTISKFTLNATFGYRILGNPSGVTFHNVLYGAAGMGYRLSSVSTIGTSFNMGQSPLRLQDSRDLTIYLAQRVSDNFRLNIYGLRGFSSRSPDWGGGINLRYVF